MIRNKDIDGIFSIIVTYNPDIEILKTQCVALIDQVCTIIYVDNGSQNFNEFHQILQNYSNRINLIFIRNPKNLGLGKAQNIGIEKAMQMHAVRVIIFDHDSIPEDQFVRCLCKTELLQTQKGINVAAVGPSFYNKETGRFYPIIHKNKFIEKKIYSNGYDVSASFIIASGMLIRCEVLSLVGLMNEDLFVDGIDNEWCARVIKLGYGIFVSGNAKMSHVVGDKRINFLGMNMSFHSPIRRYYLCRNSILMFKFKHINIFTALRELNKTLLRFLIVLLISNQRSIYARFCIAGFYDGLIGRTGECSIEKG